MKTGTFCAFLYPAAGLTSGRVKSDLDIWGKLTWVVTGVALVGFLVLVVGWYLPLFNQNQRMRQTILNLDAQIQREEESAKKLRASIESLHHDPRMVERLAREKLGYAKAGETVIRFEESLPPGAVH